MRYGCLEFYGAGRGSRTLESRIRFDGVCGYEYFV